jgi:hypothetical protein
LLPLPRVIHATQCGPRASLWISYELELEGVMVRTNLAENNSLCA